MPPPSSDALLTERAVLDVEDGAVLVEDPAALHVGDVGIERRVGDGQHGVVRQPASLDGGVVVVQTAPYQGHRGCGVAGVVLEACRQARRVRVDLGVLDVRMPEGAEDAVQVDAAALVRVICIDLAVAQVELSVACERHAQASHSGRGRVVVHDHVVQLDRAAVRAEMGRQACRVVARVVLDRHVAEREAAVAPPDPEEAAPLVEGSRPVAAADGDAAHGRVHRGLMNVEHAVTGHHAVAVDDGHVRARADDRQAIGDVEVAEHGLIVVTRSRQLIGARRQGDGVRARGEVGLHDRRAKRALAVARGTDVVPLIGVGQIFGAVDDECRGRESPWRGGHQQGERRKTQGAATAHTATMRKR